MHGGRELAQVGALLFRLTRLNLAVLLALSVPQVKSAAAAPDSKAESLEARVWTADERDLPGLEREVVRLIQLDSHSALGHQLLAHIEIRQFSREPSNLYLLKQASDLAQQAVDLAPREPAGYVVLADILDLMGAGDRAIKLLDDATKAGIGNNWRFALARARLLADSGTSKNSLALLDEALGYPDAEKRIIAPYVVGILQTESSGQELIAKLASWNKRHPSPNFDLSAGIAYSDIGDFRQAHQMYERVLKVDPLNKEARVNDAILQYRELKNPRRATEMLSDVLKLRESLPKEVIAMAEAHLGAAYMRLHAWEPAEAAFVGAIKADTGNVAVIDFVAKTFKTAHDPGRLVSLLRRVNDQVPGTGVLHALLGETLSEHLKQHDEALRAFSDAITLEPERSDYYNGMGLALYRKKAYKDALQLFFAATEVDPNDATAKYNEACVLSILGQSSEAIDSLAAAIQLDPRLVETARGDQDFALIKKSPKFQEMLLAH